MVPIIVLVEMSNLDTPLPVKYANLLSGLMAIKAVPKPTGIVEAVIVATSILEIPGELWFATKTYFPSGVAAKPRGAWPTATVEITVFVMVSIIETEFEK